MPNDYLFTKGAWLNCEYEAEKAKHEAEKKKTLDGLLNTLNEEAKANHEHKARKTTPAPSVSAGTVKLLRDWQDKYFHS